MYFFKRKETNPSSFSVKDFMEDLSDQDYNLALDVLENPALRPTVKILLLRKIQPSLSLLEGKKVYDGYLESQAEIQWIRDHE